MLQKFFWTCPKCGCGANEILTSENDFFDEGDVKCLLCYSEFSYEIVIMIKEKK